MAEVRWSLIALRDVREIEEYIARDSPAYAVQFADRLMAAAATLADTPFRGRIVPELKRKNLRELLFEGYRLVYLPQRDAIIMVRVVHGARNLKKLWRREPWILE